MTASHFRDGYLTEVLLEDLRHLFNRLPEVAELGCNKCESCLASVKSLQKHNREQHGEPITSGDKNAALEAQAVQQMELDKEFEETRVFRERVVEQYELFCFVRKEGRKEKMAAKRGLDSD